MNTSADQKAAFWHAVQNPEQPHRFSLAVPPEACVGPAQRQFLMGGAAMASAVDALERYFEKPLLWAAIHFLNAGFLDETVDIEVERVSGGRSVVQAMATLRRGDTVLQRVIGALGRREGEPDRQFMTMPEVAPPEQCPLKPPDAFGHSENMVGQFERRTVLEDFDSGLEYVWTRARHRQPVSAALLAAVSDFFLGAHKRSRGGTSLDNTLRLCSLHPTEWILCTTQVAGFANGVMQGSQCFFSQDGVLLAISSQSGLLPHTPNP